MDEYMGEWMVFPAPRYPVTQYRNGSRMTCSDWHGENGRDARDMRLRPVLFPDALGSHGAIRPVT